MTGINCCKCGKFVGKEGNKDIVYDDYNGGFECGYPICEKCLKRNKKRKVK
jgi:hypothetical protein